MADDFFERIERGYLYVLFRVRATLLCDSRWVDYYFVIPGGRFVMVARALIMVPADHVRAPPDHTRPIDKDWQLTWLLMHTSVRSLDGPKMGCPEFVFLKPDSSRLKIGHTINGDLFPSSSSLNLPYLPSVFNAVARSFNPPLVSI